MFVVKDAVREPLYAIVPYFNPWRWKSREKHTTRALKHFMDAGCVVYLVEAGFNRRELVFADAGLHDAPADCGVLGTDSRFRHQYIGLHTKDELWLKECLINRGIQNLPHDWQQVCWLDADVHFVRPNWVGECIHKLQHFAFLQMFSHARDVGPNYEMLPENYPHANGPGWVEAWNQGQILSDLERLDQDAQAMQAAVSSGRANQVRSDLSQIAADVQRLQQDVNPYYGVPGVPRVFPGLAWAATRPAIEHVGGLLDFAIWGGGDWHMAHALIEKTEGMMRNDLHRNYKKMLMQWYHRCRTHIRRNVGVMDGTILHMWHGVKTQRGYNAKHSLLSKIGFDPLRHLKRDHQGLWQLHDDRSTAFVQLREMMRKIALERDEDGTYTGLRNWNQGH